jgi:hypothetical protein
MVRRADSNFSALAVFGPVYLVAGSRRGILSWLPDLSSDASSFLQTYNLGCVKELVVWPPQASGGHPSRGVPSPLPWLLSPGLRPGGPEIHSAIASILLRESESIPRSIPVIREQTYQLSPTSSFRVAGLHPDRTASGRFYTPEPKRRKHLVLDPSFPSEARGSGFTTSVSLARLASPEVFRVITISRTYSWKVLACCGPPPAPTAVPPSGGGEGFS